MHQCQRDDRLLSKMISSSTLTPTSSYQAAEADEEDSVPVPAVQVLDLEWFQTAPIQEQAASKFHT